MKLKLDTRRFCRDHGLPATLCGFLKLYFIIDYWPVLWFRLMEFTGERKSLIRQGVKIPLLLLKPFIDGLSGARIYSGAIIGGGLLLHQSSGVIIASEAIIGTNCTLYAGASLVHKANGTGRGAPIIGDNVQLFAGCKIVGNINIGNGAVIGANSVVLHNVPPHSIAVGNPARIARVESP